MAIGELDPTSQSPSHWNLIPPSAPFNAEQRAWLNGFFAGWLGLPAVESSDGGEALALSLLASRATSSAGSLEGTSAEHADTTPAPCESDEPWHDPSLPLAERQALAAERDLSDQLMAAMAQLDCGACGYQCRTYAQALRDGQETSISRCSPGGQETKRALRTLLTQTASLTATSDTSSSLTPRSGVSPAITSSPGPSNKSQATGHDASAAMTHSGHGHPLTGILRVATTRNLNHAESSKHTTHVELELAASGLRYEPGDALAVYPQNCPELVDLWLARLNCNSDAPIPTIDRDGDNCTWRTAFTTRWDLREITDEWLAWVQAHLEQTDERNWLDALRAGDVDLGDGDMLDILDRFPQIRWNTHELPRIMPELRPRLYSISSSPLAHPDQVHLTIGRVEQTVRGRLRRGVASTWFADRLSTGAEVRAYVHSSPAFRLPTSTDRDVIMIGPGTGIAPFRGFLQHRAAQQARGANWLFFGDQYEAKDFLYREELAAWTRAGLLARLDTAFSRDQDAKIYVQDRMRQNASTLFQWLERGASLYVCGDARRMAADVDRALHDIVAQEGNLDPAAAKTYIQRLRTERRYCRDVY